MPIKTDYPRLRTHIRKGRGGRVYVYYFYDMRHEGKPDIPLGKDREAALAKWDEIHNKKPRIKGRIREAIELWKADQADGLPSYENPETRRNYLRQINRIDRVFGMATWEQITLPVLKKYLTERRTDPVHDEKTKKLLKPSVPAPTQANREISVFQIVWNYAKIRGITTLQWPAAGMQRSKWKNKEKARRFVVTDALFDAVYAEAEPMLRDCMDLSSATGMRLTDCREAPLPPDNILHVEASKTDKEIAFDVELSQVLPQLLARRRKLHESGQALHLMLLSMPDGKPVTVSKLRGAYDRARAKAAAKARATGNEEFARDIEAMILRDMRKRAANLAESAEEAQKLLQHSSQVTTMRHYRTKAEKVKPVR